MPEKTGTLTTLAATINKVRAKFDQLSKFIENPNIKNPKHSHDQFFEFMSVFVENDSENLSSLEKLNKQAGENYTKLAKWLVFNEKKMDSEKFFSILHELKQNLVRADKENLLKKEQEEKERKKKQQMELANQLKGQFKKKPRGAEDLTEQSAKSGLAASNLAAGDWKNNSKNNSNMTDDEEDFGNELMKALNQTMIGGVSHGPRRHRKNPNIRGKAAPKSRRTALEDELNMLL